MLLVYLSVLNQFHFSSPKFLACVICRPHPLKNRNLMNADMGLHITSRMLCLCSPVPSAGQLFEAEFSLKSQDFEHLASTECDIRQCQSHHFLTSGKDCPFVTEVTAASDFIAFNITKPMLEKIDAHSPKRAQHLSVTSKLPPHRRPNRSKSPNHRHFASLDVKMHAVPSDCRPTSQDFRRLRGFVPLAIKLVRIARESGCASAILNRIAHRSGIARFGSLRARYTIDSWRASRLWAARCHQATADE